MKSNVLSTEQLSNLLWINGWTIKDLELPGSPDAWFEEASSNQGNFQTTLYYKLQTVKTGFEMRIWVTVRYCVEPDITHLLPGKFALYVVQKPRLLAQANLEIKHRGLLAEAEVRLTAENMTALRNIRVFLADEGRYCWASRHVHCAGCGKKRPAKHPDWRKDKDPGPGEWPIHFCSQACQDTYEACHVPCKPVH
ncbi:MAG TPA: hypothetical protein VNG90_05725 [Candidatus Acidoferrum sp.]|nr:hypothetical protein [Candidatus Acidoferrum sp.]